MPDNIDQPQTSSGESLKGNSLDVKIGYDKRAAAKRDLAVVLQDVEGSQLTDAAGNELISEIEGFVTSELTSEKAVSVVAPTETRTVSNFYTIVFGNEFVVNKADASREDHYNNQGNPAPLSAPNQLLWKKTAHVKIKNPDPTWKQIFKGARIQIASGDPVTEEISAFPEVTGPNYPTGLPERLTAPDGHSFETFTVDAVYEIPPQAGKSIDPVTGYDYSRDNESGTFEIQFNINADPKVDSSTRLFTFLRRLIVKERSGTWKIEEVFAATSEVSSTLLGIDRAETQLSLFSNVSTYGFNSDEFVFYTDNPATGPFEWSHRFTEDGVRRYPSTINEEKNEGALRVSTYPVPYHFPYPPLTQNIVDGVDTLGLYNENAWKKWKSFLQLGKALYEFYVVKRDNTPVSDDPNSNYVKYNELLTRFLPAINIWDDKTYYGGSYYNNSTDRYYLQIDIWTRTYQKLVAGNELVNPVTGDYLKFSEILQALPIIEFPVTLDPSNSSNPIIYDRDGSFIYTGGIPLRGTGKDVRMDAGSIGSSGGLADGQVLNPYKETFVNRTINSANASNPGATPGSDDFVPGYGAVGGQYALLQSRQAFRYQPGRISGYTYGTRAFMDKTEGSNYGEWGIYNDFDEYVFRREGANFFIVRRSNIPYDVAMLQELGVADVDGNIDTSFVREYQKTIAGKVYTIQEVKLGKEKFNGDSLNGNGPSGYLLNTDEITMYKIEFGWYGAIGLRMYAYIPVEHGKARWVVVHTFVIENKLDVPSMGDPFFRFKYEVRIGDGQAPDLESPQLLYKYGTSMYIDGGDEGTVNVYSETSDTKSLAATGSYTTLMGIYPKTNIVSGGGVAIPNKKIIIPKQVSITANGFAELNFTKCTACRGNGFVYMPNLTAGQNGITRKFKKLPTNGPSDTITLDTITVTTATVTADQSTTITVTADNVNYLRPGDYLLEDVPNNVFFETRISSITANGSNYDIVVEIQQGDAAGNGIAQGTVLTFQPTFIATGSDDHYKYQMVTGDTYSKLIFPKLWNTYIGKTLTNLSGNGAGAMDTANLLMYKQGDRYELAYQRKLDPTKIVANTDTEPFPPADFFGGNTETFDCRLSQRNAIAASPNAVSGPISYIKYLNPIPTESTGQRCNWRMGFTPNKPEVNNQGKLIGWRSPVDNQLLQNQSGDIFSNTVSLPESQYVALDYHQYNQSISYTGLEQGEDWFARIHPFTQDFRIGQPKGSYTGICSELILEKNEATTVTVTEIDTDPTTGLGAVQPSTSTSYPRWTNFNLASDASLYLQSSDLYLRSTANIYTGSKSPENGQLAIRSNNVFVKVVYVNIGGTLEECFIRFAGTEQSYQAEIPNPEGQGNVEVTYYVIPIKLFKIDGTELSGVSLESAALESSGSPLVADTAGGIFVVGFNSVTMRAWFSDPDRSGRYDTPNSYTSGALATGVFEFDAFPLYPFIEMYDNSAINGAEIHDINLLGDVSTYNPQWKINQIDGVDAMNYDAGTNAQTGELNIDGVGNINQTPGIADDLVPPSFTQVNRLSSSQIDRQSESLLRPGSTMTTLYINDETKLFDLTDIFGFDRKVITPDIVNTEAVFITGRSLDNSTIDVTMNITYVEQL